MILTLNQISRSVERPRTNVYTIGGGIVDTICGPVVHKISATTNNVSELQAMAVERFVTLVQQGYSFVISDDPNDSGPKGYITEYSFESSFVPGQLGTATFSAVFDVQKEDYGVFETIDIEGMRIENKSW